eukprot:12362699-Karenia_brevis.AAC.1
MHGTYQWKLDYITEQLENSTINAEMLRGFWKSQYEGNTSKKGGYLRRGEIIKLIAERFVVQHGSFAQESSRDRCEIDNCPYMDHTGVDICYRHEVLGEAGGCRFRHDRQGTPFDE